jgi:aconitate hydratase
VRAVVARSYERIHRANLVGMGVLPLQLMGDDSAVTLGLAGDEQFDIIGIEETPAVKQTLTLVIRRANGEWVERPVLCRIDTPIEVEYFRHGGILPYVLNQLLAKA